jgi:hypothetical protein
MLHGLHKRSVCSSVIINESDPVDGVSFGGDGNKKSPQTSIRGLFVSVTDDLCPLFFRRLYLDGLSKFNRLISVNHAARYTQLTKRNNICTSR